MTLQKLGSTHKQRGPSSATWQSPRPQSMAPGTLRVQPVTQRSPSGVGWGW